MTRRFWKLSALVRKRITPIKIVFVVQWLSYQMTIQVFALEASQFNFNWAILTSYHLIKSTFMDNMGFVSNPVLCPSKWLVECRHAIISQINLPVSIPNNAIVSFRLVINYREATKWENCGSETFCPSPLKTG